MQRDQDSISNGPKLFRVFFASALIIASAFMYNTFRDDIYKKITEKEVDYKPSWVVNNKQAQILETEKVAVQERQLFDDADTGNINPQNKESVPQVYSVGNVTTSTEGNISINTEFYNLGDDIKGGYWYSGFSNYQKIKGKYIDVPLHFENQNKVPVEFFADNIILKDQIGRQYFPRAQKNECSLSGNVEIPSTISMTLNPNVPCDVHLLFEVATSSNAFVVRFSSSN